MIMSITPIHARVATIIRHMEGGNTVKVGDHYLGMSTDFQIGTITGNQEESRGIDVGNNEAYIKSIYEQCRTMTEEEWLNFIVDNNIL